MGGYLLVGFKPLDQVSILLMEIFWHLPFVAIGDCFDFTDELREECFFVSDLLFELC